MHVDRRGIAPYPHGIMTASLDIAPAGLALLDADGTVLGATPGFSRVLGVGSAAVGRRLGELLCSLDDPDRVEAALRVLWQGDAVDLEAWCWRSDEGPAAVCLVAAPLELEGQRAVYYCMVRDITDQRLAAEEHARALSLHEATLRSMADGLLVVDPAGGVLSFNQRFIDMWKIPPIAAASGRDVDLLDAVLHQLEDPTRLSQPGRGAVRRPGGVGHGRDSAAGWQGVRPLVRAAAAGRPERRPGVELSRRHRVAPGRRGAAGEPGPAGAVFLPIARWLLLHDDG